MYKIWYRTKDKEEFYVKISDNKTKEELEKKIQEKNVITDKNLMKIFNCVQTLLVKKVEPIENIECGMPYVQNVQDLLDY